MSSINSDFMSELEFERYLERFDPPPTYEEAISQTVSTSRTDPVVIHRRSHPSSDFIDMIYSSQTIQNQTNPSVDRNRQRKRICLCC